MKINERVDGIIKYLDSQYPDAGCTLDYKDPLQLMICTQLAAQCTDARVNIVAVDLFKRFPDVDAFADCDIHELEEYIRPTGFYHNKAKNIKAACIKIRDEFDRKVPSTMDELLTLDGVGRKTANLLLGDCFNTPGIVVDTHAKRLTNRMGLTKNEDPTKIEFDLRKIIPEDKWTVFCHQLVMHGREICKARSPECDRCGWRDYCKYGNK